MTKDTFPDGACTAIKGIKDTSLVENTSENATHHLVCQHVFRWTKTYVMRCHILKTMDDGRVKVLVFGDRNWKDREHVSRIRYVEADRVRLIKESE